MSHLECPSCQRTSWRRGDPAREAVCDSCGSALAAQPGTLFGRLAAAVRERFARDAETDGGRVRFVRDPS